MNKATFGFLSGCVFSLTKLRLIIHSWLRLVNHSQSVSGSGVRSSVLFRHSFFAPRVLLWLVSNILGLTPPVLDSLLKK